jgi:hypothetical protein
MQRKTTLCLLCALFSTIAHAQLSDPYSKQFCEKHEFDEAFPTDNGLFKVRDNDLFTFVDSTGNIAPGWRWYQGISNFWLGRAYVKSNGLFGLCDATGQFVLPLQYDSIEFIYNSERVWFMEKDKWGMAHSLTGKILLPAEWSSNYQLFEKGSRTMWSVCNGGQCALADNNGHLLTRPIYSELGYSYSSAVYIPFVLAGRVGFMDTTGREFIQPTLDYSIIEQQRKFKKGKIWASKNEKWGLMNLKGEWLISPRYKEVGKQSGGVTWVRYEDQDWGLVDTMGQYVIPPSPQWYGWISFYDGEATIIKHDSSGIIRSDGTWKTPLAPGKIIYHQNGKIIREKADHSLYCTDENGTLLWPGHKVYVHLGTQILLEKDGKWTFVVGDKWIQTPQLEAIRGFTDGVGLAKQKGKWGLLTDQGNWLIRPKYDDAYSAYDIQFNDSLNFTISYGKPMILGEDDEPIPETTTEKPKPLFFWFKKGKKWHFSNQKGEINPHFALDSIGITWDLGKNLIAIGNSRKYNFDRKTHWKIYDLHGNWLHNTIYTDIWTESDGAYMSVQTAQGLWGVLNNKGQYEIPCVMPNKAGIKNMRDGRSILRLSGRPLYVNEKWQLGMAGTYPLQQY